MKLPTDIALPFFAYGVFQPGQLAFHQLKDSVEEIKAQSAIRGTLRLRDGLPIVDVDGDGEVYGEVLVFKAAAQNEAYQHIIDLEPGEHYRWGDTCSNGIKVNILYGKSPKKGSIPYEGASWDGKNDPLFTSALAVVQETLDANAELKPNPNFESDLKSLFRLQMAYLLLWSSIERYVSLRYHLGDKVMHKVKCLAQEAAFAQALGEIVSAKRSVFRADVPGKRYTLSADSPEDSLDYYYQIRSNITHRGKAVINDHTHLKESLSELLPIFRQVLTKGFETM